MRTDGERVSHGRRAVLRAALGAFAATVSAPALTGCTAGQPARARVPRPDPLNPIYAGTAALLARYEATMAALPALAPGLTPLCDDHRQHLRALAREIGPGLAAASGGPSGPSPATDVPADSLSAIAALAGAEKEAAAAARAACLAAPSYRAALLGSIAAARASHGEVLV